MNEHIAGEDLAAYVDGSLKGGPKAELESHLSRCPECLAALAEIVAIRGRREKIPGEFLRQALKLPIGSSEGPRRGGALRGMTGPAKAVLPMRLVFGIAAVFLVVVLIGYYFFDRGRMGITGSAETEKTRMVATMEDFRSPEKAAGSEKAREEKAKSNLPDPKAKAVRGLKMEKKFTAQQAKAGPPAVPPAGKALEPAALPVQAERPRLAAEEERAQPQDAAGGASGGILGGVEAPLEKDKEQLVNLAAAPSARKKGAVMEGGLPMRSRLPGASTSSDAAQLFLAMTGRAAAPRLLPGSDLSSPLAIRIAGDVSRADLNDPGLLDSWSWFPEGLALELDIDAAGAVVAVTPVGPWDERAAARAQIAARELRFSASGMKSRRAIVTLSALPSN
jgi:hypothetical protein